MKISLTPPPSIAFTTPSVDHHPTRWSHPRRKGQLDGYVICHMLYTYHIYIYISYIILSSQWKNVYTIMIRHLSGSLFVSLASELRCLNPPPRSEEDPQPGQIRATQACPWVDSPAIWKYLYKYDNIARGLIDIYIYVLYIYIYMYTDNVYIFIYTYSYVYIYTYSYVYIYNNVCRHIYLYGLNIWVMRINEVCIGTKRNDFSDQSTASCSLEKTSQSTTSRWRSVTPRPLDFWENTPSHKK